MKSTQALIFERLYSSLEGTAHAPSPQDRSQARWIDGNATDQAALREAKLVRTETLLDAGVVALLQWNGGSWYCMPFAALIDLSEDEDVLAQSQNAGLASIMLSDPSLEVDTTDPAVIRDAIMGKNGAFGIDEILPLFRGFRIYTANPSFAQRSDAEQWSRCQALCAKGLARASSLPWVRSNRSAFREAAASPAAGVVGENLLYAVRAGNWRHCYLEVYRGIETLFRVHCVESLVAKLPGLGAIPRGELSQAIDDSLQWRMREDTVFGRLVALVSTGRLSAISAILQVDNKPEKVAATLYRARNLIAHGSFAANTLAAQRDALISAALLLLSELHGRVTTHGSWFV